MKRIFFIAQFQLKSTKTNHSVLHSSNERYVLYKKDKVDLIFHQPTDEHGNTTSSFLQATTYQDFDLNDYNKFKNLVKKLELYQLTSGRTKLNRKIKNGINRVRRNIIKLFHSIRWLRDCNLDLSEEKIVFFYSFTGNHYNTFYKTKRFTGSIQVTPEISREFLRDCLEKNEPIYHSTMRTAYFVKFQNPELSLVNLSTSIEISLKKLLIDKGICENLDYVSVKDVFEKVKESHSLTGFSLPKEKFDVLSKIINERNRFVHGGKTPQNKKIDERITEVQKLLYSIDYCLGDLWAKDKASPNYILGLKETSLIKD